MHNRIKSKQRRKNMRKWMEHKARREVFDAMAHFGTPRNGLGDMIIIDEAANIPDDVWAHILHHAACIGVTLGV